VGLIHAGDAELDDPAARLPDGGGHRRRLPAQGRRGRHAGTARRGTAGARAHRGHLGGGRCPRLSGDHRYGHDRGPRRGGRRRRSAPPGDSAAGGGAARGRCPIGRRAVSQPRGAAAGRRARGGQRAVGRADRRGTGASGPRGVAGHQPGAPDTPPVPGPRRARMGGRTRGLRPAGRGGDRPGRVHRAAPDAVRRPRRAHGLLPAAGQGRGAAARPADRGRGRQAPLRPGPPWQHAIRRRRGGPVPPHGRRLRGQSGHRGGGAGYRPGRAARARAGVLPGVAGHQGGAHRRRGLVHRVRARPGWLHVPVLRPDGAPAHTRGVTAFPGLYVAGYPWLSNRGSGLLYGAAADAARVAQHIAATGRSRVLADTTRSRIMASGIPMEGARR
jgi:hypothetical protein